ncbi:hypothetical protein A0H81_02726 [Grifola frondosa]|uniref:F-box domain-containing protein n=1 Tax=Grifola frondosa TaxID=5627 RepID=A0A1C7MRV5_GRIFR|nr:hypothetical protein A0H81_02726 [Grifola frondosa]
MTALDSVIWSCNHSPISIDNVWPTLPRCQSLKEVQITDNLVFASNNVDVEEDASRKPRPPVLRELKTVGLHSTKHTYGATRNPDLSRISAMLSNCPNLEVLDIGYTARQMAGYFNPVADDFLLCGRWPNLRSLTLTNLWCTPHAGFDASAAFLYAHANLEVLHLDIAFGTADAGRAHMPFVFPPNCLPRLREVKASKELVGAILQSPCDAPGGRPLEIIKGVRLSGSSWDHVFLANLKRYGVNTVRRLELVGWNEMEDARRAWCPYCHRTRQWEQASIDCRRQCHGVGTLLANMPELTTFHGVRFFYEVSSVSVDPSGPISLSDRSRVRKNDEVASVLAWKCSKLRRLDHWEESSGKVIVLLRDSEKVRYEVRRIKA